MGKTLLFLGVELAGAVVLIGRIGTLGGDILASVRAAAAQANIHQIETALELYHYHHERYPNAQTSDELLRELAAEGYIRRVPTNASPFVYTPEENGQEYSLTVRENETQSLRSENNLGEFEGAY